MKRKLTSLTFVISIFLTGCGSNLKPIPQVTYVNTDTEDIPSYEKVQNIEKKYKMEENDYKPIYRQKVELRRGIDKELKETYRYSKELENIEERKEKLRKQKQKHKKIVKKIKTEDNNTTGNKNEIIKKYF